MPVEQCFVCHQNFQDSELIVGHGIRHSIEDLIKARYADWDDTKKICWNDYSRFRDQYVGSLIEEEHGQVTKLDNDVVKSIEENEIISENINSSAMESRTMGEVVADRVASFGGSWNFIFIFAGVLFGWILINSIALFSKPFDPYPYILMNLILSCLAAVQAPIIMMSQNRQEKKDRLQSENDYKVNLKSEIEIKTLHEKMDHLLLDQWSKMMEIQQLQMEMLEDIRNTAR